MNIYKIASGEQLDFFKEPTPQEEPIQEEAVPEVDNGIRFLDAININNAHFVQFQIKGDLWVYRLSFPEYLQKVKQIAKHSHGRALTYAQKHKKEAFKVTEDWPQLGSIIREELEKGEENERDEERV